MLFSLISNQLKDQWIQYKLSEQELSQQDLKFEQDQNLNKQKFIIRMLKNIQDYNLLQKVGEGQYGNVYKAQHQKTKALFAIKVMALQKFKSVPKLTELTNNQMTILSQINHPNIIRFVEMLQTNTHYFLVYEFCNGGTLEDKIKTQKMINQKDSITYFMQLISAFSVLYEKNILHRDIKPTNILFHNGKLKLADFGFCKELQNSVMAKTMVGSPIYMAPQVLKAQEYDHKADIWSLGVVLYEMLYGHCPYEDNSIPKLISMISNTMLTFPKFPRVCEPLRVFIKRMLVIKAPERIQPKEFIKYPLELVLQEKDDVPAIKMDQRGALKFTRNNILYLSETLVQLAPILNELQFLRVGFLVYKIFSNVCKATKHNSFYWEELQMPNNQYRWDQSTEQQLLCMKPYGQVVRDSIKKCDNSLKLKLELEKQNVDTRYFVESTREIKDDNKEIKNRLINCLLINIHYLRVIDKKKPDWQDYTTLQKDYQQKEDFCLRYARYN